MTSYGGFSFIAKLFEKINLKENIERIFPITETSPNSKGVFSKVLKFGLTVFAGGTRFAHSAFLGDSDKVYSELFGVKKIVKSSSAITRLLNKINTFALSCCLTRELWEYIFANIIPLKKIKSDYVNFDSKIITRYGKQEGVSKGYNSKKKGRPSHHPIIAFLHYNKYVVNLWNRDGSSSSGNGIVEFAKETMARLDGHLSVLGCIADTGYYNIDFIKYLESKKLKYIIGAQFHHIIQKEVAKIKSWTEVDEGIDIAEFYFEHKDNKWDKKRRYVVVRQRIDKLEQAKGKQLSLFAEDNEISKYRYGCYITSMEDEAIDIWRQYRLRASDENIIKENTYDFALEGFSLNSFYATEAAMLLRILFYNIINLFRREMLSKKESGSTLSTLRKKYLIIPASLGRDGHKHLLRIGVRTKGLKEKIKWILRKIDEYFAKISTAMHLDLNI
jgi:hypothetical protein